MQIRDIMKNVFLFSSFSEREMELLLAASAERKVKKGDQLFSEGTEANAFFIVVAGKVKIHRFSPGGKEHILHIHGPGDLVAEAAIFDSMVYPASCTTLEESILIRISRDVFLKLLKEHPEVCLKMMSAYSKRLRQFVSKIEELSLKDIKSRLAEYLVEHSSVEDEGIFCRLKCSKRELSSLLGTVPETLSRALSFFKDKGLIEEKGNRILIPDIEKLRMIGMKS